MPDAVEPAVEDPAERRRLLAGPSNCTAPCRTRRGRCDGMGGLPVSCRCPPYPVKVCMSVSKGPIFISGSGHVPHGSGMTTKIIYFMVNGKLEKAEFGSDCSAADVKGKTWPADFKCIIKAEWIHQSKNYFCFKYIMKAEVKVSN